MLESLKRYYKTNTNTKIILSLFVIGVLLYIFYSSRQIFYFKYEPEYYENLYYHSQWSYPGSARGISDGALYKFVGYRLVEGENPFDLNFEIPPFAKYMYGLAEKTIGNPYWVSIAFYLLSVYVVYRFCLLLFESETFSLALTLLFVSTPFVSTQVRATMLDLPLMFMYLVHTFLLVRFIQKRNLLYLIGTGIFLGLATGTKPGVYTPGVALLAVIVVVVSAKEGRVKLKLSDLLDKLPIGNLKFLDGLVARLPRKLFNAILFLGSLFAGYVLSYFSYFIRHPNPIPWLRLHEKPLKFYLQPGSTFQLYSNQWTGIFLNRYKGWWTDQAGVLGDWSILLPLGTLACLWIFFHSIFKKNYQWIYISGVGMVFLVVNTFIPIFPRYLVPLIPIFIFSLGYVLREKTAVIVLVALFSFPSLVMSVSSGPAIDNAAAAGKYLDTFAYRELYRSIDPNQRKEIEEDKFIKTYEYFVSEMGVRDIDVEIDEVEGKDNAFVYRITYKTRYGDLLHEPVVQYKSVNNEWKMQWSWDFIWDNYVPDSVVVIEEGKIPAYRLVNNNGTIVAERGEWKTLYIIPRVMFDWTKHLNMMSAVTSQSSVDINSRLRSIVPDHYPRFVGYIDPSLGLDGIEKASAIPGATLKEIDYLVIKQAYLSNEGVAKRIKDERRKNPEHFYMHANILIENPDGEVTSVLSNKDEINNIIIK